MTGTALAAEPAVRSGWAALARALRLMPNVRGKGRLAQMAFRHMSRSEDWTYKMQRGHTMCTASRSTQTWFASTTGRYDEALLDVLIDRIKPGSWILDVGACFGFYTVPLAAAAAARSAAVIAVEPLPANQRYLSDNLARNGVHAEVWPFALGRTNGVVHTADVDAGNAAVSIEPATVASYALPVRRLDDEATPPGRCTAVKVDVEGFEFEVLAGAEALIQRDRPLIVGEFNANWLAARGTSETVESWCIQHGYTWEPLGGDFVLRPH